MIYQYLIGPEADTLSMGLVGVKPSQTNKKKQETKEEIEETVEERYT
jgi:hypothetical protein